ncbi:unnamed protein product [Moneuplotes crassus]|uniref:Uncharacterized protein n=1 Tax=Euplotes crassus TaxID=5936 RepID=A0AAD2DAI8_EUPCR|nr:unnamed protein product [Moneuplotes crassus]
MSRKYKSLKRICSKQSSDLIKLRNKVPKNSFFKNMYRAITHNEFYLNKHTSNQIPYSHNDSLDSISHTSVSTRKKKNIRPNSALNVNSKKNYQILYGNQYPFKVSQEFQNMSTSVNESIKPAKPPSEGLQTLMGLMKEKSSIKSELKKARLEVASLIAHIKHRLDNYESRHDSSISTTFFSSDSKCVNCTMLFTSPPSREPEELKLLKPLKSSNTSDMKELKIVKKEIKKIKNKISKVNNKIDAHLAGNRVVPSYL